MEKIIFFKDVNFISKNNEVFSPNARKCYLFMVDDFPTINMHNDFPFKKEMKYFKENKYNTGFIFDDKYVPKSSIIGFTSYNPDNEKKSQTKYLVYLGLYANEKGKMVLAFVGNNGVPFESEAEVFTFRQKNMDELEHILNLYTHNKDGEVIETWSMQNMDKLSITYHLPNGIAKNIRK